MVFFLKRTHYNMQINWALHVTNARKQSSILKFLKENKNQQCYIFYLLLRLNFIPFASQCTKYSISFSTFLNLWKTKIWIIFTFSNFFDGHMKVQSFLQCFYCSLRCIYFLSLIFLYFNRFWINSFVPNAPFL